MFDISIGTAPVNWNNQDVPHYRPPTPYLQMLDEMARAGYTATEFDDSFPADASDALTDLRSRGLRPASTFCALNLRHPDQFETDLARAEERARYVAALGGDVLIVADSEDERRSAIAGRVTEADSMSDESWEWFVLGLHMLAARCQAHGVRIVFHNHVATHVETGVELSRLLDATDPSRLGLCLDVGHLLYGGGDISMIMKSYGHRVQYVHLKDVDMAILRQCRREQIGWHEALLLGIFCELGQGGLDIPGFFDALEINNYAGWVIVEQDTTRKTPAESARANREYLRVKFGI